jgi:inosose dehydratase
MGLNQAGKICADYGLRLVYHPHLGTNIESQPEIMRLLENTRSEWVSLVVDTGHLTVAGVDPTWIIRNVSERVHHVHMKSVRTTMVERYHEGLGFLDSVREGIFTVPGDGQIDFEPIVRALIAIKFAGWCVIEAEQDPSVAEPNQYMTMALEYLRHLEPGD